jgi:hypothetical protein
MVLPDTLPRSVHRLGIGNGLDANQRQGSGLHTVLSQASHPGQGLKSRPGDEHAACAQWRTFWRSFWRTFKRTFWRGFWRTPWRTLLLTR